MPERKWLDVLLTGVAYGLGWCLAAGMLAVVVACGTYAVTGTRWWP